jgi:hypothetical protein
MEEEIEASSISYGLNSALEELCDDFDEGATLS